MKTKNKVIGLLEIAIVLCSMFLVALPAIAAEQTMQEVSACTIATTSEDETLEIYGNANEDDTIDMRDLTYVKLIFFGKKPETELADAKYDGKINPLDFIQIKLIIVGKEKELTLKCPSLPLRNIPSEVVTIHKPVKRIVVMRLYETDVLRVLNAADKIVGIRQSIKNEEAYYPEISKLPSVGSWRKLDYEAILSLNPDIIILWGEPGWKEKYEEKLPGVTPIVLGLGYPEYYAEAVIQLGYILNKRTEAEAYINWHEGYLNKIKSRTEGLSEDEKPRVFNWAFFKPGEKYRTCKEDNIHQMCVVAGGKDIVDDIEASGCPTVDPEWVVEQNPDIIIALALAAYISDGYGTDDPSEMAAAREDILSRLELGDVNAVETGSVYMMNFNAVAGSGCLIGTAYMAKLFHPDLFEDLDPEAIHQEYMELQHFDFNVYEHGVFIYPPVED